MPTDVDRQSDPELVFGRISLPNTLKGSA